LPILFLLVRERGIRFAFQPSVLMAGLIALASTFAWYAHAHSFFLEYENTFTFIPNKFSNLSLLLDPKFYAQIFVNRLGGIVLTPLGYILMVTGLLLPIEKRAGFLFHYWFLAIIVYFFIAGQGNLFHDYYQYPLLPVASVLIGRSLIAAMRGTLFSGATIINKANSLLHGWKGPACISLFFGLVTLANLFEINFKQQRALSEELGDKLILVALVTVSIFLTASATLRLSRRSSISSRRRPPLFVGLSLVIILLSTLFFLNLNEVYSQDLKMLYLGGKIASTTSPNDLIIVTTDSSFGQLYYAHRKGWGYFKRLPSVRILHNLQQQGAQAFVTDRQEELREFPDLAAFLGKTSHRELGHGYKIYFLQPYEQ
jgi:hypothetical protein